MKGEPLRRDQATEAGRRDSANLQFHTHLLFPPLPLYGPPSLLRDLHCTAFWTTPFFLSTGFLAIVVLGSVFTSIPRLLKYVSLWLAFQNPDTRRPFTKRRKVGHWLKRSRSKPQQRIIQNTSSSSPASTYEPLEGGPDKLVCDAGHYARRVGLGVEEFKIQTEDGFILSPWHVYDPQEYTPSSILQRRPTSPLIFTGRGG